MKAPKPKTKFKQKLIDLLRPENWYYVNPQKLLGVYKWMATTGDQSRYHGRYGVAGAQQFLSSGAHGCVGKIDVFPFGPDWVIDLQRRFLWVFLSEWVGTEAQRWKDDHNITIDATRWIMEPWYDSWDLVEHMPWIDRYRGDTTLASLLTRLLSLCEGSDEGEPMVWELNPYHRKAVAIQKVSMSVVRDHRQIRPWPMAWMFSVHYGYPNDSSSWERHLAIQDPGEPLLDTIARAWLQLRCLQGKESGDMLEPVEGLDSVHAAREGFDRAKHIGALDTVIRESFGESEYWALVRRYETILREKRERREKEG